MATAMGPVDVDPSTLGKLAARASRDVGAGVVTAGAVAAGREVAVGSSVAGTQAASRTSAAIVRMRIGVTSWSCL
jgi:hypothetical protein